MFFEGETCAISRKAENVADHYANSCKSESLVERLAIRMRTLCEQVTLSAKAFGTPSLQILQ